MQEQCGGFALPLDAAAKQALADAATFGQGRLPEPRAHELGTLYVSKAASQKLSSSSVIALGAFDGLHLGHRALIARLVADACSRELPSVVVTFDPDPSEVVGLRPEARLLSVSDRVRGLFSLGADAVLVMHFTPQLAGLAPAAFCTRIEEALHPASVHVGTNFRFGARGAGDISTLQEILGSRGIDIVPQDLALGGTEPVSATRIRHLLAQGALDEAAELLGRCHYVRGLVMHGRGEGTGMGFATANVQCEPLSAMPAEGVYGGYVVVEGVPYASAINVGAPKSFEETKRPNFLEAHLLGFSGDIYGREVQVVFCRWLRAQRRFSSMAELEAVVRGNIEWVHVNLSADSKGAIC